ncbi:adenosylcobinamide-phosphate synthase CbiB [Notoacmeibacter ruber]|uniref:adenosylcobinamide-phosphate synthase CbiB n=1 Tax=Notoacmeibacter ruber TaxID=2670375 RepID=UPI00315C9E8F
MIEAIFGYSSQLYAWIGHPVTWIGKLIDWHEKRFNLPAAPRGLTIFRGVQLTVTLVVVAGLAGLTSYLLPLLILPDLLALMVIGLLVASLPAQRSLHQHVGAVRDALKQKQDLGPARQALSMIVGRDTAQLNESEIARAATESLSENFSDGVTAPAIWLVVGGPAGGLIYKAVNTADSMIGHRNERYEAYGKAVARLDDLLNLPASRLSALLIIAAAALTRGADAKMASRAVLADAHHHTSPNAGWPEAAMAGALGLALAGPRTYAGSTIEAAVMNRQGRRDATAQDIDFALRLYRRADALLILLIAAVAFLLLL